MISALKIHRSALFIGANHAFRRLTTRHGGGASVRG